VVTAITESWMFALLEFLAVLLIFVLGGGLLVVVYLYIRDVTQTQHAIRRNYPVIGRFRYFFEHMGEFFRQYFFAMDREELPFNRAERSWVYRAAKNVDSSVAFGSTRDLRPPVRSISSTVPIRPSVKMPRLPSLSRLDRMLASLTRPIPFDRPCPRYHGQAGGVQDRDRRLRLAG
jgi:hypothetical protein